MGHRVGIDVGGTFTDLICVTPGGEVLLDKTPSTPDNQAAGVLRGIDRLAERLGLETSEFCASIDLLVHGTTVADNTMIEQTGASTGLLVTAGHRDEIELRRTYKENIWDPADPPPFAIAPRRARIPIDERIDADGNVLIDLDEEQVRAGVARLKKLGVTSIGVCYLFSFLDPGHELRTRELIREEYPDVEHISLSHEVLPKAPEFERTSATIVNAYVAPKLELYLSRLMSGLRDAGYPGPVLIMQSTGGVMPPDYVARLAVTLLGSGPTAGVIGSTRAAAASGVPNFLAADMGGTSYDVGVVRAGKPDVVTDWNWRYRYYIALPMVDVKSIGAGGGSVARVKSGALLVGPDSAGAVPGPACYGHGGDRPTVTDANLILGYLPSENFAGGSMTLDMEAARNAIHQYVAEPLGIDVEDAAWGIARVVNANMANEVRRVLASKGVDARELAMVAYGGNGAVHAAAQAAELGIRRVLIPRSAPAFSALGLLVADYLVDLVRAYVTSAHEADGARLKRLYDEMMDEAKKELAPAGLHEGSFTTRLIANVLYPGQNFDLAVPFDEGRDAEHDAGAKLIQKFHDLHESERGYAFRDQQPILRSVRLVSVGLTPKPDHLVPTEANQTGATQLGSRRARFDGGWHESPVLVGSRMATGESVAGPVLIQEPFTVIVVPPNARIALAESGNFEMDIDTD